MGSCIAPYHRELVTGPAHLLGVYWGKKLIANAEVCAAREEVLRLVQLPGRFNGRLPEQVAEDNTGTRRRRGGA